MSDETRGIRAVPPALLLALAGWLGITVTQTGVWLTASEPWRAIRLSLTADGIGFTCEVLAIVGTLELARRLTGRLALGLRVAAAGFIAMLAVDAAYSCINFMERAYDHAWIYKAASYGYWAAWVVVPVGFAVALWQERRGLAIAIVVVSLLLYPPELVAKHLFSWLPNGKAGFAIDGVFRVIRFGVLFAGVWSVARGVSVSDRVSAAAGLRAGAYSMWLRLVAAIGAPLLMLMSIGGRGGPDAFRMMKVATFGGLVINVIALVQFARGALRASSANVGELGRWNLAVGGAAATWSAGVGLAQLSWVYKVAFGGSSDFLGSQGIEYVEALGVTVPLVAIGGVALAAIALGGLAARIGNDELRAKAQSRGAAFVILSLANLAIRMWWLPEARFESSAMLMTLLAMGAMLVALVMIARLFNDAADELESEPGLPPATVVTSDAT